jgi:hypothetical protein
MYAPHYVTVNVLDYDGNDIAATNFMVDHGSDDTSFPGIFLRKTEEGMMVFETIDGEESSFEERFVTEDELKTGGDDTPYYRINIPFSVKIGTLDPIQIDSMVVNKSIKEKEKVSLLLGRDVLFRHQGSWFPSLTGEVQLSLENVKYPEIEQTGSIFTKFGTDEPQISFDRIDKKSASVFSKLTNYFVGNLEK